MSKSAAITSKTVLYKNKVRYCIEGQVMPNSTQWTQCQHDMLKVNQMHVEVDDITKKFMQLIAYKNAAASGQSQKARKKIADAMNDWAFPIVIYKVNAKTQNASVVTARPQKLESPQYMLKVQIFSKSAHEFINPKHAISMLPRGTGSYDQTRKQIAHMLNDIKDTRTDLTISAPADIITALVKQQAQSESNKQPAASQTTEQTPAKKHASTASKLAAPKQAAASAADAASKTAVKKSEKASSDKASEKKKATKKTASSSKKKHILSAEQRFGDYKDFIPMMLPKMHLNVNELIDIRIIATAVNDAIIKGQIEPRNITKKEFKNTILAYNLRVNLANLTGTIRLDLALALMKRGTRLPYDAYGEQIAGGFFTASSDSRASSSHPDTSNLSLKITYSYDVDDKEAYGTIDHVIPQSAGGQSVLCNLQLMKKTSNEQKSSEQMPNITGEPTVSEVWIQKMMSGIYDSGNMALYAEFVSILETEIVACTKLY